MELKNIVSFNCESKQNDWVKESSAVLNFSIYGANQNYLDYVNYLVVLTSLQNSTGASLVHLWEYNEHMDWLRKSFLRNDRNFLFLE